MSPCNQRYTCAWLQCQIYNLLLLCDRPKPTNATPRIRCLLHDHIVRLKPVRMPEGKTTRLHRERVACVFSQGPPEQLHLPDIKRRAACFVVLNNVVMNDFFKRRGEV